MAEGFSMYSLLSKILHLATAFFVFPLFAVGFIMTGLDYYSPWYQTLPNGHYIAGLVFAFLLVLRFINALLTHKHPQQFVVKAGHYLIYTFMFGCVITGYMLASDDLFFFPSTYELISVDKDTLHLFHKIFTYGLMVLIAGHIAMALIHQFYFKEALLEKMFKRS